MEHVNWKYKYAFSEWRARKRRCKQRTFVTTSWFKSVCCRWRWFQCSWPSRRSRTRYLSWFLSSRYMDLYYRSRCLATQRFRRTRRWEFSISILFFCDNFKFVQKFQNEPKTFLIDVRPLNQKKIFVKNIRRLHTGWFIENRALKCIVARTAIHLVSITHITICEIHST